MFAWWWWPANASQLQMFNPAPVELTKAKVNWFHPANVCRMTGMMASERQPAAAVNPTNHEQCIGHSSYIIDVSARASCLSLFKCVTCDYWCNQSLKYTSHQHHPGKISINWMQWFQMMFEQLLSTMYLTIGPQIVLQSLNRKMLSPTCSLVFE